MDISEKVQRVEEEFREKQEKLKRKYDDKQEKLDEEFEKAFKKLMRAHSNELRRYSTRDYRTRERQRYSNIENSEGKLPEEFFAHPSKKVAMNLVGRLLICNYEGNQNEGVITEVGAYEGEAGKKQKGLSYAPGKIYLPALYGKHTLAIATAKEGTPSVVTIRKVKTKRGELSGEGLYTGFNIDKHLEGCSISNHRLYIAGKKADDSKIEFDKFSKKAKNCRGYYILAN